MEALAKIIELAATGHTGRAIVLTWLLILSVGGGWQLHALNGEIAGIKESIVCSNLKSDIEKNRADIYEVERTIEMLEMEGETVPETTRRRRSQLMDTLRDNEATFGALGCLRNLV